MFASRDDQLSAQDRACAKKPASNDSQRNQRRPWTRDVREVRASYKPPDKDSRDSKDDGDPDDRLRSTTGELGARSVLWVYDPGILRAGDSCRGHPGGASGAGGDAGTVCVAGAQA